MELLKRGEIMPKIINEELFEAQKNENHMCHGVKCKSIIPNAYNFCSFKCACSKGHYLARHYGMKIIFSEEDIKNGAY